MLARVIILLSRIIRKTRSFSGVRVQRHGVNQQVLWKRVRRVRGTDEKGAVRRAAKESGRDGAAAALSGGRWGLGSGCRR
jgi:hypothetical protein